MLLPAMSCPDEDTDALRGPDGIQGVVYDPVGAERIARLDELFMPEWEQK